MRRLFCPFRQSQSGCILYNHSNYKYCYSVFELRLIWMCSPPMTYRRLSVLFVNPQRFSVTCESSVCVHLNPATPLSDTYYLTFSILLIFSPKISSSSFLVFVQTLQYVCTFTGCKQRSLRAFLQEWESAIKDSLEYFYFLSIFYYSFISTSKQCELHVSCRITKSNPGHLGFNVQNKWSLCLFMTYELTCCFLPRQSLQMFAKCSS